LFSFFFKYSEKYADINWDELGFNPIPTDYMFVMKCAKGENFLQGNLTRFGNIELSPSAAILNNGQVSSKQQLMRSIDMTEFN
jgi:hypothetical protein